ncbi:MAG: hypothetical protein WB988_27685 [Candidatus Nitrosopolaris sp.]|jgi:hypothetical protein
MIYLDALLFERFGLYSSSYHKVILLKDKRVFECALCGRTVASKGYDNRNAIVEIIEGETYTFDRADCALMFKKFRSVYGPSLFNT